MKILLEYLICDVDIRGTSLEVWKRAVLDAQIEVKVGESIWLAPRKLSIFFYWPVQPFEALVARVKVQTRHLILEVVSWAFQPHARCAHGINRLKYIRSTSLSSCRTIVAVWMVAVPSNPTRHLRSVGPKSTCGQSNRALRLRALAQQLSLFTWRGPHNNKVASYWEKHNITCVPRTVSHALVLDF